MAGIPHIDPYTGMDTQTDSGCGLTEQDLSEGISGTEWL